MKIAQVIGSLTPGGAEVFVKNLSIELKKMGYDIEIWVLSKAKDIDFGNNKLEKFETKFVNELKENGINLRFVSKRPNKDWIKTKKALKKFFYEFKPDIIHSHLVSVTFHVCRSLSKKAPIVQTIHSTVISHPFIQKFYLAHKLNGYVAISKKVEKIISKKLNIENKRIFTIFNGIQLSRFWNKRTINKNVRNLVAVGRLVEAKDYPNLFKALKLLKLRLQNEGIVLPNVSIVGDGPLEDKLKKLVIEENINNMVRFLGIRGDVPKLLAKSDIYVMSSEWEGFSISLIEALASGIPIVATDAGSNSEIIDNGINGMIVPIKRPDVLADALYLLITNFSLRQKFSAEAIKKAKNFSIETCAKRHMVMYEEVLNVFKKK